jgi:small-conductance mechanosensitive channel
MKFETEVAQEERRPRFEEKIVRPLNQAATTLLLGLGLFAAMRQLGVDIGPLLAVTGISGIAFGLGAQSLIASLVSGLNLVGAPLIVFTPAPTASCIASAC